MDFLKLLNSKDFIVDIKVLKRRVTSDEFYYKVAVDIKDKSRLFAKEYKANKVRNYSFHWQDINSQLIIRWDNVEHHKYIKTHPHHKHLPNTVEESHNVSLDEVLDFVENKLGLPTPK